MAGPGGPAAGVGSDLPGAGGGRLDRSSVVCGVRAPGRPGHRHGTSRGHPWADVRSDARRRTGRDRGPRGAAGRGGVRGRRRARGGARGGGPGPDRESPGDRPPPVHADRPTHDGGQPRGKGAGSGAPGRTPVFRHGDAVLAQSRVKEVFGEFAGRPRPDGTVAVHPSWVGANIRTVRVPVLGEIRCHRLVIPQVRAALEDLEGRNLGHLVDPADYGGCYYPRFIGQDPGTGLSRHSWGIAIDINISQGITGGVVSFALLATAYVWLTRSSKGRLLVPTGKIGLGLRRMLLVASVFGLMYSIAAYLVSDSIPLALLAGVAIGVGVFVVVPIFAWRVLKPQLAL